VRQIGGTARGYQDFFAPSARTAVPVTTGLRPRRTVYLFTGTLGMNVRFCPYVLSHSTWDMSHEREASTAPSHRDDVLVPLSWPDSTSGLRTCLMIGETTDGAGCLTYLSHRT
jgi:hypothetical protein